MSEKMRLTVRSGPPSGMLATQDTKAGALQSGEPRAMGGRNLAPNSIEMLLASWAGCLVASARLAALEHGLDLGALHAEAEAEIKPRSVAGDRTAQAGLLSAVACFTLSGPVEDLPWLCQEIEARSPVSQTLRCTGGPPAIEISRA